MGGISPFPDMQRMMVHHPLLSNLGLFRPLYIQRSTRLFSETCINMLGWRRFRGQMYGPNYINWQMSPSTQSHIPSQAQMPKLNQSLRQSQMSQRHLLIHHSQPFHQSKPFHPSRFHILRGIGEQTHQLALIA